MIGEVNSKKKEEETARTHVKRKLKRKVKNEVNQHGELRLKRE